VLAAAAAGAATALNYLIMAIWPDFQGYALAYLVAIVVAARTGYGPGLFAAALSFAIGGPIFTFKMQGGADPIRMVMAVFISLLVSRLQKRSEEVSAANASLSAVLNAATQTGIVGVDPSGKITLFNTGAETLLGYPAAEVVGKAMLTDLVTGEVVDRHAGAPTPVRFDDLVKPLTQSHYSDHDFVLSRRDGARLIAQISLTARRDGPDNELRGYVAVFRDITDLRRNEEAMLNAMRAAEAAAKTRSDFLATMSHEIRTPLNGVIGMTGLLLETPLAPEQEEFASTIRNCGESLLTVINDILDFSKIEAGKLSLEEIEFDIYTAIEECAEIVAPTAHYKEVELVLPARLAGAPRVRGDQGRLRQIVLNLLSNAIKFTTKGEVVITVEFQDADSRATVVKIAVADTGIGIAREAQEHLFHPFSQGDTSTTRRYGGTGLGLAISKRLVELMGGEIGLASEAGKGSTFWFTAKFGVVEPERELASRLTGRRLLVVDDNATNRRVLQLQLERHGCEVRLAKDATEAMACLTLSTMAAPFDAVLTDQNMPGMGGSALASWIRGRPELCSLPILLLGSQIEDRERIRGLGVNEILLKPVRESQLIRALHTVLPNGALPETAPPLDAPAPPRGVEAVVPPAGGRVLVVEDNAVNQRVVALMLRKLGYSPEVAANGSEALRALELGSYNAILMDCQMPEMDGFEAARAIRSRPWKAAATPIIALTANALQGERERCVAAGMNDYLAKPLTLELLSDKLREWSGVA
jgi:two-component system sensor histidine kinase/response regulator